MPIAIVTALGRSKKQALPIPPLLGTALLKRFLEDPAVDNLAINSVAPRLLGTCVCKTSLDFSFPQSFVVDASPYASALQAS